MSEEDTIRSVIGRFFPERPPLWLIDVGVGLGREAHALKALWPDLKAVGFEPNPEAWRAAVRGEFPGVLHPFGAWSEACSRDFATTSASPEWGTLYPAGLASSWSVAAAELVPLDILGKLVDRAVLWIDVEGAELEVLKGAHRLLTECRVDLINLEARSTPLYPGACTEAELTECLAGYDFEKVLEWNRHGGDDPHWDSVYRRKT